MLKERPWNGPEKDVLAKWAAKGGDLKELAKRLKRAPVEIVLEAGRVGYRVMRDLPDQRWIIRTAVELEAEEVSLP